MTTLLQDAIRQAVTVKGYTVALIPNDAKWPSSWGVVVIDPHGDMTQSPTVIAEDIAISMYQNILDAVRAATES